MTAAALIRAASTLAAFAASTALAQPTFEPLVGFRDGFPSPVPPIEGEFPVDSPGTYELTLVFGAFNAQGFTNRGMFNFIGTMTMTDPAGSSSMAPRASGAMVAPYSFGNVIANPNPTTVTFDANRGAGGVDNIPWEFGQPAPADSYTYPPFGPGGASGAPDTYHPGVRFTFTITDATTPREIFIDVSGTMQAVTQWFVTTEQEPEPGFPGFQNLLPGGFVSANAQGRLVILIPAPGAAALLALGALATIGRRRRDPLPAAV